MHFSSYMLKNVRIGVLGMSDTIVLTYETLYEVLRLEKTRAELQPLEHDFLSDVVNYLKEKQILLKKEGLFAEDEKIRTEHQLSNVKKILKELYEKRERKIVDIALNISKTQSNTIPTSAVLAEERNLCTQLVQVLNRARSNVLMSVLGLRLPVVIKEEKNKSPVAYILIRFSHAVPKFLGTDLSTFGPFEENDVASIPRELGQVIINKKRGKEIQEAEI
jgi:hypothetical protein